jgi:hypothetical protein
MKPRPFACAIALLLASFTLVLPVSAKDKAAEEHDADKDGKKNITTVVLTATAQAVHDAALQAIAAIGGEIKKDAADAIEAKRPNKVGLAVGSGGEKLFVAIKDLGEGKTELKVTTKKTMLGIVGQKLWNEEIAKQVGEAVK